MSKLPNSLRRRDKHRYESASRRSSARRLRIETLEGRVLLSGNTLDLATFGNDLAPASYQTVSAGVAGNVDPVKFGQFNLPTMTGDSLGSDTLSAPGWTVADNAQYIQDVVVSPVTGEQYLYVTRTSSL